MISIPVPAAPPLHDRLREAALAVAAGALALMPVAMWLASRSAPLFLAIAAIACLAAWTRECALTGRMPLPAMAAWLGGLRAVPALGSLAAFLAFALLSILWSHERLASLKDYAELVIPIFSGMVVAAILPGRAPRWAPWGLLAGLVIALGLTALELAEHLVWRRSMGLRAHTFIFNRTLITALMLAIPLAAWLITRGRSGLAVVLMILAGSTMFDSESGAGKLGVIVAGVAAFAAMVAPRISVAAAAAGMVALFALAPVKGEILDRLIPPSLHQRMQESHSRDRVDIWLSFGEAIRARPFLGSGFGASPTLDRSPVAQEVPAGRRPLLGVGHPHSLPVQLWTETGLVGALLLLSAGLGLIVVIGRLGGIWRMAGFGMFCGALAIAAVGHGAWQGWWIAALAAAIAWIRILRAGPSRGSP